MISASPKDTLRSVVADDDGGAIEAFFLTRIDTKAHWSQSW